LSIGEIARGTITPLKNSHCFAGQVGLLQAGLKVNEGQKA